MENKEVILHLKNVSGGGAETDFSGEMKYVTHHFPMELDLRTVVSRNLTMETLQKGIAQAEIDQERLVVEKNIEATMLMLTGEFQQLGSDELSTLDRATATARKDELRYRAEIHNRFSMSASCWFFAFLGGPFAMLQARRQFITSFILCFLPILIMYYPVMFLMINLCKTGTLEPWWAMWVPNLIIGGIGLLVLRKVVQH